MAWTLGPSMGSPSGPSSVALTPEAAARHPIRLPVPGFLVSPVTADVTFHVYADGGAVFEAAGDTLLSWRGEPGEHTGTVRLKAGSTVPVTVAT